MMQCLGRGYSDLCYTSNSRYFRHFFNLSSNQSSHGPRLWRIDQERIKSCCCCSMMFLPKIAVLWFHHGTSPPKKKHTPYSYVTSAASCVVCVCVSWGWYRAYFQVPGQWQSASLKWVGETTTWWLRIGGCSFWWAFISVNERGNSKLCKRMV